jgi:hypothetical protein
MCSHVDLTLVPGCLQHGGRSVSPHTQVSADRQVCFHVHFTHSCSSLCGCLGQRFCTALSSAYVGNRRGHGSGTGACSLRDGPGTSSGNGASCACMGMLKGLSKYNSCVVIVQCGRGTENNVASERECRFTGKRQEKMALALFPRGKGESVGPTPSPFPLTTTHAHSLAAPLLRALAAASASPARRALGSMEAFEP